MSSPSLPRYLIAVAFAASLLAPATARAQMRAEPVVSGLVQPVAFVQDPSNPSIRLVVQQNGRIRVVRDGTLLETDFLDLSNVVLNFGEQGLLGLAFAPDYATSGRVFVNFINLSGDTVIARFTRLTSDPPRADPASRFDLRFPPGQRFISQPFSNHNGGHLAFGPDGYLYIGMGDGGSGNDPMHNAQNPQSLLGKMLRIDVNVPAGDPEGYNVPPTNPFAGVPNVLQEIWSFGLRNPWRWSFDNVTRGGTGAIIIGDVGQAAFEEINYEPAGRSARNYGWRNREGAHDNVTSLPPFSLPLIDPIFEYSRNAGQTVTGGYVYRGLALGPPVRGRYFFADFGSSRIWSLRLTINPGTGEATASDLQEHTDEFGNIANPSSFGEDSSGELYVIGYGGTIYRIAPVNPAAPPTPGSHPRRRPADAPIVGFAVPRPSGSGVVEAPASVTAETPRPNPPRTTAVARWFVVRDDTGAVWIVIEDDAAMTPDDVDQIRRAVAILSRRPSG